MIKVYVDGSTTQTCTVIDGIARILPITVAGDKATNNYGEYCAVLAGLRRAMAMGLREVEVLSDSQLVVYQLTGKYRIKNVKLGVLARAVKLLISQHFDKVEFTWIPREENPAGEVLG